MDWRRNTGQRTETEALDFNELESLKNRPAATKLLSFTTKKKKILISFPFPFFFFLFISSHTFILFSFMIPS
jgi:hypothetical protein